MTELGIWPKWGNIRYFLKFVMDNPTKIIKCKNVLHVCLCVICLKRQKCFLRLSQIHDISSRVMQNRKRCLGYLQNVIYYVASTLVTRIISMNPCDVYASVKWIITDSGNGLSLDWHQAATWTNADVSSIGPVGTNILKWFKYEVFYFVYDPFRSGLNIPIARDGTE